MADQLQDIFDEVEKNLVKQSDDIYQQAAREAEAVLHAKSPRKKTHGGAYAAGWAVKRYTEGKLKGYIVYNKDNYQLTHLLEKGHAKVNGGRVRAIPHIRPVEEAGIQRVLEKVKQIKL